MNGFATIRPAERYSDLREWQRFLLAEAHVLKSNPQLLFQQAANQPDGAAPAAAALWRMEAGVESRPWFRSISRLTEPAPCLLTLLERAQRVAFSPDARFLATAAKAQITIWDIATGARRAAFSVDCESAQIEEVTSLQWSTLNVIVLKGRTFRFAGNPLAYGWGSNLIVAAREPVLPASGSSSSEENILVVIDAESGALRSKIDWRSPDRLIGQPVLSPDGEILLFEAMLTIKTLNLRTGEVRDHLALTKSASSFAFVGGVQSVVVSAGNETVLVDLVSGSSRVINGEGPHYSLASSPQGALVFGGRVWRPGLESSITLGEEYERTDPRWSSFSPNGTRVAARFWPPSGREDVILYNASTGRRVAVLFREAPKGVVARPGANPLRFGTGVIMNPFARPAGSPVNCAAVPPVGDWVATGADDGLICLYDTETGALRGSLPGHTAPVEDCICSRDGSLLCSRAEDGVRIWDPSRASAAVSVAGHGEPVKSLRFVPGTLDVLSASERSLRRWNCSTGELVANFGGAVWPIASVDISPDTTRIVTSGGEPSHRAEVLLWDAETGERLASLVGHSRQVNYCSFLDARRLLTVGDCSRRLYDLKTGKELSRIEQPSTTYRNEKVVGWSPGRGSVFSFPPDPSLTSRLVRSDPATGQEQTVFPDCRESGVQCVSPDGRYVAGLGPGSGLNSSLSVWDAVSGSLLAAVPVESSFALRDSRFCPDSECLLIEYPVPTGASSAEEPNLACYKVGDAQWTPVGRGRLGCISPDGRLVAALSDVATVYEITTGRQVVLAPEQATSAAWSPDGRFLVLGKGSGTVSFLRIEGYHPAPPLTTIWSPPRGQGGIQCPMCWKWSVTRPGTQEFLWTCPECNHPAQLTRTRIKLPWRQLAGVQGGKPRGVAARPRRARTTQAEQPDNQAVQADTTPVEIPKPVEPPPPHQPPAPPLQPVSQSRRSWWSRLFSRT